MGATERGKRRGISKALAIALLLPAGVFAQSTNPPLSFGAVNIQAAKPGDRIVTLGILPNGRFRCRNTTLRALIAAAYDVEADRVTGGPDWLDSDRFDLFAQTAPTSSKEDRLLTLQALLAERFKLVIDHDKKAVQVYALTVGSSGPKLRPTSDLDTPACAETDGDPTQSNGGHVVYRSGLWQCDDVRGL